MKSNSKDIKNLLKKVEKITKERKLDLSSGEDLSIGVMNLIAIEEHLFYTSQKTGKKKYLDILDEVRKMRIELMKELVTDYEGEVWCVSKHLLSASMRVMEVGTKELKKGNKKKAWSLFEKSYNLYSLFWGLNLGIVKTDQIKREDKKNKTESFLGKLGQIVQKAINCCKE